MNRRSFLKTFAACLAAAPILGRTVLASRPQLAPPAAPRPFADIPGYDSPEHVSGELHYNPDNRVAFRWDGESFRVLLGDEQMKVATV